VLPLLGPSSLRDTAALPVDMQGDIVAGISDVPARNTLTAVRIVDTRADLLKATVMLDEVALDKYTFVRDAYLQRRRSAIFDGNPPSEDDTGDADVDQRDIAQGPVESLNDMPTNHAMPALNNTAIPGDERVQP
jgi:phospholipid-binding lipoprotein MlaA